MKVKFLQSYISKLNGVSFYYEDKKEIMFLSTANNTEKYWRITYKKDVWQDRGYSISGESLEEYEVYTKSTSDRDSRITTFNTLKRWYDVVNN